MPRRSFGVTHQRERTLSDSARKGPGDGRIAFGRHSVFAFLRTYAVLIMIVALMVFLTIISDAFLTPRNLLNMRHSPR